MVADWTGRGKPEEEARAFVAKLLDGKYVPHVIEPSAGTDRLALALLEEETLDHNRIAEIFTEVRKLPERPLWLSSEEPLPAARFSPSRRREALRRWRRSSIVWAAADS